MKKLFLLVLVLSMAFAGLFSVRHFGGLYAGEDNVYTVAVTDMLTSLPIQNASVKLYKSSKLLGGRATNATGYASFLLHPKETGLVAFSITKKGYNEYVLFQQIVARPTPTPTATPTPTPAPANTTAKMTGFISMSPSEHGMFLFVMLLAFASLFGASTLFYNSFVAEGAKGGAWDMAEAFKSLAGWLEKK